MDITGLLIESRFNGKDPAQKDRRLELFWIAEWTQEVLQTFS